MLWTFACIGPLVTVSVCTVFKVCWLFKKQKTKQRVDSRPMGFSGFVAFVEFAGSRRVYQHSTPQPTVLSCRSWSIYHGRGPQCAWAETSRSAVRLFTSASWWTLMTLCELSERESARSRLRFTSPNNNAHTPECNSGTRGSHTFVTQGYFEKKITFV